MIDFIVQITCAFCENTYPARLGMMRLNLHDPCPLCGFENSLSEKQAIGAWQLLEKLQWQQEMMIDSEPTSHSVRQ